MILPNWLDAFEGGQVLLSEPLHMHTTFKIGGPADIFIVPADAAALAQAVRLCRENDMQFFLLGKGSNVLFSDKGFRGAVISTERLRRVEACCDGGVYAEAGAELKDVCDFALSLGLEGLEFACGIPGSVGGATFMNAGAYDGELRQVVESVTVLLPNGSQYDVSQSDMRFGYRQSRLQAEESIALATVFRLSPGDKAEIAAKMKDLTQKRTSKQPLEDASAGSTFKRPEGYFAGKLIMDAGLRGHRIGGAQVSEKHCGFVINAGGATAAEVLALIEHIRHTVHEQSGVWLEAEVRLIGEE